MAKLQKPGPQSGAATFGRKRRQGRPSYKDIYPIAAIVEQILKCNPAGADRGRRETTNYTTLSLKELTRLANDRLRQYCIDFNMPFPKKFPSTKTIRRLGKAPNPRFRTAKNYKNVVPFRTAARNNDATAWHEDFHYTAATVKLFSEMAYYFDGDCAFLSCDNKNKVRFGAPANPNVTRPRGMYLENQRPSMPDHSFPTRDAHIVPYGYMTVSGNTRIRSLSGEETRFR